MIATQPINPISTELKESTSTHRGSHNVLNYGAIGDGIHDDTQAIQTAFDSAKRGDKIIIPAGEYVISKRLILRTSEVILQGYGTLFPSEFMDDFLIEIGKGSRETIDYERDTIGMRLIVEALRINGCGRSKGVFFEGHYHSSLNNVYVMRTKGCAVKCHDVRESDFNQMSINFCYSDTEEPLLDLALRLGHGTDPYGGGWQFSDQKTVDGQNNIRFFGANIVHSMAKTFVDIGADTHDSNYIYGSAARNIHFSGCQFHLSPPEWFKDYGKEPEHCENNQTWDVDNIKMVEKETLIRIRNASTVTFSQCNIAGSPRANDVALQLGDHTGSATDCSFIACRIRHTPIVADHAKHIKFLACTIGSPNCKEKAIGKDISEITYL